MISSRPSARRAARRAAAGLACALAAGCSTPRIDSARQLGAAGCAFAGPGEEAAFASRAECQRALDAEAFFHGYAGQPVPEQLLAEYRAAQAELAARRQVFARLGEAYEAFQALAGAGAEDAFAAASSRLGDAVNGYACVVGKTAAVATADKDALGRVGGLLGKRAHRHKLQAASAVIQERLEAFAAMLEDPLVRTQLTSFRKDLAASRAAAVKLLWEKGLLDPSPLINDLAGGAGLKASKDAAKIIVEPKSAGIQEGLSAVVSSRSERRLELIEQGYDTCLRAVRELAAQHRKLESGETASLARLRALVAELQLAAAPLSAKPSGDE